MSTSEQGRSPERPRQHRPCVPSRGFLATKIPIRTDRSRLRKPVRQGRIFRTVTSRPARSYQGRLEIEKDAPPNAAKRGKRSRVVPSRHPSRPLDASPTSQPRETSQNRTCGQPVESISLNRTFCGPSGLNLDQARRTRSSHLTCFTLSNSPAENSMRPGHCATTTGWIGGEECDDIGGGASASTGRYSALAR